MNFTSYEFLLFFLIVFSLYWLAPQRTFQNGILPAGWTASVILPVGLSFFTLKKLAYILDVSQGALRPTYHLLEFALFVAFFPKSRPAQSIGRKSFCHNSNRRAAGGWRLRSPTDHHPLPF